MNDQNLQLAWGKCYYARQKQHLGQINEEENVKADQIPLIAAAVGSEMTRTCSKLAFDKFGRSMQTSDMLEYVGKSFEEVVKRLSNEVQSKI